MSAKRASSAPPVCFTFGRTQRLRGCALSRGPDGSVTAVLGWIVPTTVSRPVVEAGDRSLTTRPEPDLH